MPLPDLYVVRHGEYDESQDGSLTLKAIDAAHNSAVAFGEKLGENAPRTAIYTSEQLRTIETGEIFAEALGVDPATLTQAGILKYLRFPSVTPDELFEGAREILAAEAAAGTPQVLMVGHMEEVSTLAWGEEGEIPNARVYASFLNEG